MKVIIISANRFSIRIGYLVEKTILYGLQNVILHTYSVMIEDLRSIASILGASRFRIREVILVQHLVNFANSIGRLFPSGQSQFKFRGCRISIFSRPYEIIRKTFDVLSRLMEVRHFRRNASAKVVDYRPAVFPVQGFDPSTRAFGCTLTINRPRSGNESDRL